MKGQKKGQKRMRAIVLLAAAVSTLAAAAPVGAAVYSVTKTADTLDNVCDADCSLREAVVAANASPGHDAILLPAGTYTLTRGGRGEDQGAQGDLDLLGDVTLLGAGAGSTVIDAARIDRVLHVAGGVTAEVQGVTLEGGLSVDSGGGAILNNGRLTLAGVAVLANETQGVAFGGGIYTDGNEAVLTVRDSTLANNNASGGGGGAAVGGTATFTNVTFSGNQSTGDFGGGLYIFSDGKADFNNVTIAGNSAAKRGGGVFAESSAFIGLDQPEFRNSIIAGNTAVTADPDCSGSAVTGGYNILGIGTGCFGFSAAFNDQVGTAAAPVNPGLGALADNGGPVTTRALLAGSTAIDRGNPAAPGSGVNACETHDARGAARPADGNGNGEARCDVGAFEVTGECVNGGSTLCLNDGRFRVTAAWRTNQGQSGQGQGVRLTDDSGYFWFFDPENIEVTLKVLNACTLTPGRFWVFAAGLTNVEVTLTVTDTASGQVKTYVNPQDRRFRPIFDTGAFATCP